MQNSVLKFQRNDGSQSSIRIAQGEEEGTHIYTKNNDYNGKDTGKDWLLAPFDCVVKAIRPYDNQVLFENVAPVNTPSGVKQYVTFSPTHMDDADFKALQIAVGKRFKQGERIYREGTKGIGSGNHIHFSQAFGPFKGGATSVKNGKYYQYNGTTYPQYSINADNETSAYKAFFAGSPIEKGISDIANRYPWQTEPEKGEEDVQTRMLRCTKGTLQNGTKYPTRPSLNAAYSTTNYLINVNDLIQFKDAKPLAGKPDCYFQISGGDRSDLIGRWFAYDKNYFD